MRIMLNVILFSRTNTNRLSVILGLGNELWGNFWNANKGEQEVYRARQMIGRIVSDSVPEISCLHSSHSVVY